MAFNNAEAVAGLAQSLGIEPLQFDSEGVCELVIDAAAPVTLEGDPEGTRLRINGVAGDLPDPDSAEALQLLLKANFNGQGTGGAALGMDYVTQEIVLGQSVDVERLGVEGLAPVLTEFANYLAFWRSRLADLADAAEEPAGGTAAPVEAAAAMRV